jgi:hypothetical protein
MELLFDSRRYNLLQVDEYFADSPLPITLELGGLLASIWM